ncbi:hypothetical protein FH972_021046 [Carpinus fangiana]|uniref:Uncharacterized protein n=1 Tax=Carpinus fangiana TaxID=176857 RepID=A0A5N6KQB1_9ROSI|nr:hypothetical protein FH972_021046 [Carpinus fangiana]
MGCPQWGNCVPPSGTDSQVPLRYILIWEFNGMLVPAAFRQILRSAARELWRVKGVMQLMPRCLTSATQDKHKTVTDRHDIIPTEEGAIDLVCTLTGVKAGDCGKSKIRERVHTALKPLRMKSVGVSSVSDREHPMLLLVMHYSLICTVVLAAANAHALSGVGINHTQMQVQLQMVKGPNLYPPANPKHPHKTNGPPQYPTPTRPPPKYPPPTPDNGACAKVSKLVANAPPSSTPTISAKLAWDCEQSVPLNATAGLELVDSIRPYIEWQSTLAYLKNPPKGYLEPAVDVFAEIDGITSKLQNGGFKNEYDFEFELYRAFQRTHDGHFRYLPNILSIFGYFRQTPLVSVSTDGKQLPKPYVYSDIVQTQAGKKIQISPVVKIDGQSALAFLENWSQYGSLQDPDALYNNVFYELAAISLGATGSGVGTFAGGGRGAYIYPGPTTTLTFANGTTKTYDNFARVKKSFSGVKSGADVYKKLLDAPITPDATVAAPEAAPTSTPAPGYPPPVLRQSQNLIGGYYINKPGYKDVAVLSVPSFVGDGAAEESFQDIGLAFLQKAFRDGKKKLVIDVSANGGGTVHQGYNLFAELFPHLTPYGATRFRAHDAYNTLGQFVSNISGPVYPPDDTGRPEIYEFSGTPFNYRADVDNNYKPFQSWAQKYGPHQFYGDQFTPIIRWNLSDFYAIGLNVSGYGNRTNVVKDTYFLPQDIVIVYDGYCASTCTIFSEFMRQQGHVKTIALGGRSRTGLTQAVGGVKGVNDYLWADVYTFVSDAFALATPQQAQALARTKLNDYTTLPFRRGDASNAALNVRDGLRQGDASQTPLQFVYEAADCRIYYTPEMTVDASAIWEASVDVMWKGKACAAGGLSGTKPYAEGVQTEAVGQRDVDVDALLASFGVVSDQNGRGAY